MAVGLRNLSTATSGFGASTVTVPAPSGITAGDLCVIVVVAAKEGATGADVPAGWTGYSSSYTNNGSLGVASVFYKTAGSSEGSVGVAVKATSCIYYFAFTGANNSNPFDVGPVFGDGTSTAASTITSFTPANGAAAVVVYGYLKGSAAVTTSTPAGWTLAGNLSAGNYERALGFYDVTFDGSTATGTASSAFGGGQTGSWRSVTFSISQDAPSTTPKTDTDSATLTETSDVLATSTGTDTASLSETSDLQASTTGTDSATLNSETADLLATPEVTDSALLTEYAEVLQLLFATDTDTFTFSESDVSIEASMLVTETFSLTETTGLLADIPVSDSATLSDIASINVLANDSATLSEDAYISIVASDEFTLTETVGDLFAEITDTDSAVFTDEVRRLKNAPPVYEDQINYSRLHPIIAKSRKPYRVLAQDIQTKEFIHNDLPLSDPEIGYKLSAPNSFKATLNTEIKSLEDLSPGLIPGNTWLHVEESNTIRQSTILQPFVDSTGDQKRQIEGVGFTDYANQRYYQGPEWKQIQIDPADIIRYLWNYIQGETGMSIGVSVSPDVVTPVRLGTPQQDVEFQTGEGEDVSFEAGPYDLNYWEVTNVGTEFNKLCKQTPIDYVERSEWNGNRTDVCHYIDLGYPRIGTKRTNLYFREGENLAKVIPEYTDTPENFPSSVIIIGAGEGPTAIRGIASQNTGRIPYEIVIENEDITSQSRANDLAKFELKRRTMSRYSIKSIDVDTTHINAPWGTFIQGDDILVEGKVRYVGRIADYNRITEYTYSPRTRIANLSLSPSSSFSYGATPELDQ